MPNIGSWVVGVTLQFKSNTSTEIKSINAALKALREGEIKLVQKEFTNLSTSIAAALERQGKLEAASVARSIQRAKRRTEAEKAATEATVADALAAQKKIDALRKSIELLRTGFDPQHSLASQMKILELTEKQIDLRKKLALSTDKEERERIQTELKALDLAKQEETVRKGQLLLQERLGKIQDTNAHQAQVSQEKLQQQAIRNQNIAAGVALKNEETIARAMYAAQVEQERRDLAAIREIAAAKKAAIRDQARAQREAMREQQRAERAALREQEKLQRESAAMAARPMAALRGFGSGLLLPSMFAGGFSPYIVGMGLRDLIGGALGTAGAFQTSFQSSIGIGGLNARQQGLAYNTIASSVNKTGLSPVEEADIFKEILRLTTGTMSREQSIGMLPDISGLARILQLTRGARPKDSADAGVEIMHLLRDYNPADAHRMMTMLLGMGEMMPQDLVKTVTQLKQYAPAFKNLGVPDSEALGLMVFLSRAGLGTGRSGTAARALDQNAFKPLTITSYMQAIKNKELTDILGPGGGEQFYYKDKGAKEASFHELEFLDRIAKFGSSHPNEKPRIVTMLSNVFGQQGAVIANLLSDPQMVGYLDQTIKAMHQPSLTIDAMLDAFNKSNMPQQIARVKHNWDLLEIDLMKDLLPSIAHVLGAVADGLYELHQYIYQHPGSVKGIKEWIDAVAIGIKDFTGTVRRLRNPIDAAFNALADYMARGIVHFFDRAKYDFAYYWNHGVTPQENQEAYEYSRKHHGQLPPHQLDDLGRPIYGVNPNDPRNDRSGRIPHGSMAQWLNDWFGSGRPGGSNAQANADRDRDFRDIANGGIWNQKLQRYVVPKVNTISPTSSPRSNITTVKLDIHGDVYGMPDFDQKVSDSVRKAMAQQQKNPLHHQAKNPSGTSAFAPPFLSLTSQ